MKKLKIDVKNFRIGQKVVYDGFKCMITSIFVDCETGIEYANVKPLEFDSFEREAKLTSLRKI